MVYCGNNAYDPSLEGNGGRDVFGTHVQCFRKGYARGYNQTVKDKPRFVQKWAGRYKAYISQKLWHSDDKMPPGYQLATLAQTMQRGYALGSIALAKKLKQNLQTRDTSSKQKPKLPIRTTTH